MDQIRNNAVTRWTKIVSIYLERFTERDLVWFIVVLFAVSVATAAHVGINGTHQWRQSDVLAAILGFHAPENIPPFTDFFGRRVLYDIPIYQFCAAILANLLSIDVLPAVRYLNIILLFIFVPASYKLAENISVGSGKYLLLLVTFSPLFVRYWSAPLPDLMSLSFGVAWLSIATSSVRSIASGAVSILCLLIACIIKSPVPFVLLIFYATLILLKTGMGALRDKMVLIYAVTASVSAISAEIVRSIFLHGHLGVAQDPTWYFGTLEMRMSPSFWSQLIGFPRWELSLNRYVALFMFSVTIVGLVVGIGRNFDAIRIALACITGCLSGWLVFTNLYIIHDYYHLPSGYLIFILVACMASVIERTVLRKNHWPLMLLMSSLLIASAIRAPSIGRDLAVTSPYDVMSFLLNDYRHLFVVPDSKYHPSDPTKGGKLRINISVVSKDLFESTCELPNKNPVLIMGNTECIDALRQEYDLSFKGSNYHLFLPRR